MLNKSRDSLIQSCIHLTEKHGIRDMPGSGLGTMVGTIASAALKEHTVFGREILHGQLHKFL